MDAGKDDTRRTGAQPGTVPGLGPVPTPRAEAPPRLDPALDPDRYDAARDSAPAGRLDPARDPDRYDPVREVPPGQGQTLPDLLGDGAHEDQRDNYQWAIGLIGVLAFLALVSWFFGSVATP
ncbi:MAG TPA: hypothetical protein VNU26_01945 [Mycobacteriales bacterium]|nr:hypothetical protein [Mycobacteriales bacterium]